MTNLYLIEPDDVRRWRPFCHARPIAETRAGVWLIRERWEAISGEAAGIFAPEFLHAFSEDGVPTLSAPTEIHGPAVIGQSTFAPTGIAPEFSDQPARLINEDETVGWWIPQGTSWALDAGDDGMEEVALEGVRLHGSYDLLTALELFLPGDVLDFTREGGHDIPDGCVIIGDPHDIVILSQGIEPGVTFDVRDGPIVVEQHAYIRGGSRLEGPLYIGPGSDFLGGDIRQSVVGPRCKLRGEISSSVFIGYANKGHEGFVGHSVIGRWVNFGAGTTTSNLKNTYGKVTLDLGDGMVETERQFLGSLVADHVKTAIGTMFSTGTIVGFGANVFGDVRPPKYIGPMAWGNTGATVERDGFLSVAERVMPRRQVPFDDATRSMLIALYDHAITP